MRLVLDEHWPPKLVMVSVVSSIPTGSTIIFWWHVLKPRNVNIVQKSQICVVNKNFEWVIVVLTSYK